MSNGTAKGPVAPGVTGAGSERSGEPAPTVAPGHEPDGHDPEVLARPVRRRFSAAYKERIVREAAACTQPGEIGALLRREGLYSSHLGKWRERLAEGGRAALADDTRGRRPTRSPLEAENARLRRQNARLEQRLRQAEGLLEIQKKVSELLGIPLPRTDEPEGDA